jgi:hypothetical protein
MPAWFLMTRHQLVSGVLGLLAPNPLSHPLLKNPRRVVEHGQLVMRDMPLSLLLDAQTTDMTETFGQVH